MRKANINAGGALNIAINPSNYINARVLAAGVAESTTVPDDANMVIFNCITSAGARASFWTRFDGTAATIPTGDVTDGTASEPNPYARLLYDVTTISAISPQACILTLMFYR